MFLRHIIYTVCSMRGGNRGHRSHRGAYTGWLRSGHAGGRPAGRSAVPPTSAGGACMTFAIVPSNHFV